MILSEKPKYVDIIIRKDKVALSPTKCNRFDFFGLHILEIPLTNGEKIKVS